MRDDKDMKPRLIGPNARAVVSSLYILSRYVPADKWGDVLSALAQLAENELGLSRNNYTAIQKLLNLYAQDRSPTGTAVPKLLNLYAQDRSPIGAAVPNFVSALAPVPVPASVPVPAPTPEIATPFTFNRDECKRWAELNSARLVSRGLNNTTYPLLQSDFDTGVAYLTSGQHTTPKGLVNYNYTINNHSPKLAAEIYQTDGTNCRVVKDYEGGILWVTAIRATEGMRIKFWQNYVRDGENMSNIPGSVYHFVYTNRRWKHVA